MKSSGLLVFFVLVAWVNAGPINFGMGGSAKCAMHCTASNKFKYMPGKTYEHEYHVTTETLMEGAGSRKAIIQISAIADIEVENKCDFILKLRDVKLFDTSKTDLTFADNAGRFRQVLERSPLRFSFQDGIIEDLCPAENEDPWALNIKRGILTSLQNSMYDLEKDQTVKEIDVTGNCVTDYKIQNRGWYTNTIRKTKDLMSCTDRHGYRSAVHATPYRVPSGVQSPPLMNSMHVCDHEVDRSLGILNSVICRESHVYRPFSNHKSGAVTNVIQKLLFKSQRSTIPAMRDIAWNRANMNFRHVAGFGNADPQMNVEMKVNELCTISQNDVRPDTPRVFSELVYMMRTMDSASIMNVYKRIQTGALCRGNVVRGRKFFLDAIPMIGTGASVEIMKEMLVNNVVSGVEVSMWLTSFVVIQNPSMMMLEMVAPLLEVPDIMMKAMLPVTTLVNNYCQVNPACAGEPVVDRIVTILERVIGSRCYARNNNLDLILMALRALGNAGHVPRISAVLNICITQAGNPIAVKIAAIEAFRRLPCQADRSAVVSVFRDVQADSEVRVAAYLAAMQCPAPPILEMILQTLENERVSQVGSFVWSHLTNLMETASPHKQYIRAILENEVLKAEFNLERMKYSRNYEGSFFFERLNTGAVMESNVVWSPKSFIPRSAMVNLTVDLFGNSINLLDFGGRVEGLEYLLETYLGPYGYFGDKNPTAAASQLNKVRGSVYMRMFGNELAFQNFRGMDFGGKGKEFSFMNLLKKLSSDHDYSLTQSVVFLDSTMVIPTSSGLPLMLAVNGTATVDLKAKGKVDLRKMFNSPRSLEIDGIIQPSGAVLISGSMSVDAGVTKTGMRVVNTWHSSTSVRGRVQLDRGKILSAEIDVPKDKMEILDVTTAFFTIHGDIEEEEKLLENSRKMYKMCSGSRMATVIGLETCVEMQFINASMVDSAPYFPMTGPFAFRLNLLKRDTHTSYKFLAKHKEMKSSSVAQLAFNTPGSSVDRALAFDMTMNYKHKHMDISLVTPWKAVTFTGSVANDRDMKKLSSVVEIDGRWRYGIISTIAVERSNDEISFVPHVEITMPGAQNIVLNARVTTDKKRRADITATVEGIATGQVAIKSSLVNTNYETSAIVEITTPQQLKYFAKLGLIHEKSIRRSSVRISPTIMIKTPTSTPVSIIGDVEYRAGRSIRSSMTLILATLLDKPISFKCDLKRSMNNDKYDGDLSISSKYLVAKMDGSFYLKKTGGASSRLTLDYSMPKYFNIPRNRLTLSSKLQDKSTKSLSKYFLNANLDSKTTPHLNFQADMDFSHSNNKYTGVGATIRYGKSHELSGIASLTHRIKSKLASLEYTLTGKSTAHDIEFAVNGDHKQDKKYLTSTIDMKYGKEHHMKAALNLKDSSSKKLSNMFGDFSFDYPGKSILISTGLTQPSHKEYTHTINVKYDQSKSVISTTYRRPSKHAHAISSDIIVPLMKPVRLIGMADLDPEDLKLSGQLDHDNNAYGLTTKYKYAEGPKGKWTLDINYPSRHVEMEIEGERIGSQFAGKIDTKWDADRDKKQRLMFHGKVNIPSLSNVDSAFTLKYLSRTLQLKMRHDAGVSYITHAEFSWLPHKQIVIDTSFAPPAAMGRGATQIIAAVQTPFRGIKDMRAEISTEETIGQISAKSSFSWNAKEREISVVAAINKPVSLQNIDLSLTARTPWKNMHRMNFGIVHRFDTKLNTNVKVSIDRRNAQLVISGQDTSNYRVTNIESAATFRSNIGGVEDIVMKMLYHAEADKFFTDINADINGLQYVFAMDMHHAYRGYQIQNSGKLRVVIGPYFGITNNWNHLNTDRSIKTVINSDWGRGQILHFNLAGLHASSPNTKTTGSINIQTPWKAFQNVDMNLSNEFGTGLIHNRAHLIRNGVTAIKTNVNFITSPGSMEVDVMVGTPWMDDILAKLKTQVARNPMIVYAELQWSPSNKITASGSMTVVSVSNFNGEMRITTPYSNMPSIVVRGSQAIVGSEYVSTGTVEYGIRKAIEFESRLQMANVQKFWIKIETPFEEFRLIEAGIEFSGGLHDFRSRSEVTVSPIFGTMKGILNWNYLSDMRAKVRIDTPFESFPYVQTAVTIEKTPRGKHFVLETEYSPSQVITIDIICRISNPFIFEAQINTPFVIAEHISVALQTTLRSQAIEAHMEAGYGANERVVGDLKMMYNHNSADITIDMKPFIDNAAFHVEYLVEPQGFGVNVRASVAQFFVVTGSVTVNNANAMFDIESKVEYRLEEMRGNIMFNVNAKMIDTEIQMAVVAGINGQIFDINIMIVTMGDSSILTAPFSFINGIRSLAVIIKTPLTENIVLNIEQTIGANAFVRKIHASFGDIAAVTATINGIRSLAVIIKTPLTENIVLNIEQTNGANAFVGKIHASFGDIAAVTATINANFGSSAMSIDCEAEYTLNSVHQKATLSITANDNVTEKDIIVVVGANGKIIEINMSMMTADGFHGKVDVKTPFDMFRNTGLTIDHSTGIHRFDTEFSIRFMDGKAVSGKINHFFNKWQKMRSGVEIRTPIAGYEMTKAVYRHTLGDGAITGTAHITYGAGNKISTNVKVATTPTIEFEVILHTPFIGYEDLSVTGEFSNQLRKYVANTMMRIGQGRTLGFTASIDLSVNPITATIQITTPLKNFETAELTLTHGDVLRNVKTTARFTSPYTDSMKFETVLRFASLLDFEGTVVFKSNIANMRDLKLIATSAMRHGRYVIHNVIAWAPRREIVIDGTWQMQTAWGRTELISTVAVTTPFIIAKQASIKFQQGTEVGKFLQKIEAVLNGDILFDIVIDYEMNTRHEGSVIIQHPRPMHFSISGLNTQNNFDGDMMLNWNKDEPNSNIRVETAIGMRGGALNKNIKFKVIHPSRTMGIVGSVKNTPRHTSSMGELIWDEVAGHKLAYDFSLNDRSRGYSSMHDSSMKFGIPGRTIQMTGSYGDDMKRKTIDGSLFWDVDRDQAKEIGIKAIFIPAETKADVIFRLPYIGKDVTIGTEMTVNEGRTLFNGKTEISYSMDIKKTLTFMSRVEDVSAGYGSTNYSVVLGVFHPYTDLACRLSGNMGKSRDMYSAMMDVNYLTSRRENMNVALRAQINRLRNQMNLEVVSPGIMMEMDGEVLSTNPLKVEVVNRINNLKVMKSAITVDPAMKLFDIETNYDIANPDRKIRITAKYVDSKTIQAQVAHTANSRETTDLLINMKLNTARMLHTVMVWQPNLMSSVQTFMTSQMHAIEARLVTSTSVISTAIGEEIEARYVMLVDHIEEEVAPVFRVLQAEMEVLFTQLEYINTVIKAMYNRNDLFIRTIGNALWVPVNIYDDMIVQYRWIHSIIKGGYRQIFATLRAYPIKERYFALVHTYISAFESMVNMAVKTAVSAIEGIDEMVAGARQGINSNMNMISGRASDLLNTIMSLPWAKALRAPLSISHYKNIINSMSNSIADGITASGIPNYYNAAIHSVISGADVAHLHGLVNDAYQQGIWAYSYWNIEANVEKYVMEFLTIVKEIVMEEITREFSLAKVVQNSRIIVFDPVHGNMEFDLFLPFPVTSLESMPQIIPYLTRTTSAFTQYVPQMSTIRQYYDDIAPVIVNTINASSPFQMQLPVMSTWIKPAWSI